MKSQPDKQIKDNNQERRREHLILAGYSMEDANLLAHMGSEEIANKGKVFVDPITMQTNLESGIVTYERLDKARWIITDGLNQLRKIWKPTPAELELEQDAKRKYEKEKFIAEEKNQPAPKPPKELPKLPPPFDWMLAPLHMELIPFEWAIKPFTRNNSEKAETLVGWKSMTGLGKAISSVFPPNEARRILDALRLTIQDAALLFIDYLRQPEDQLAEPALTSTADMPDTWPLPDVGAIIDVKLDKFLSEIKVDGDRTRQEIQKVLADTQTLKDMGAEESASREKWRENPLCCREAMADYLLTMDGLKMKGNIAVALLGFAYGNTCKQAANEANVSEATIKRALRQARTTDYAKLFAHTRTQKIQAKQSLKKPDEVWSLFRKLAEEDPDKLRSLVDQMIQRVQSGLKSETVWDATTQNLNQ